MEINKDLHVSTMTFVSKTNTNISLEDLFNNLSIDKTTSQTEAQKILL